MRCLLIAGSPQCSSEFIKTQYKSGDYVVCADKGYEFCKKAKITPNLIVGDFDSNKEKLSHTAEIIRLNPVKDDTDTLSAIKEAVKRGCDEFLILGALGGRLDHTYANLSLLLFLEKNNYKAEIKTEDETVRILINTSAVLENVKGKTFSVFPFGCESVEISYNGKVAYPAQNYEMTSDFPVGISNVFLEENAEIKVNRGNAVLIINNNV